MDIGFSMDRVLDVENTMELVPKTAVNVAKIAAKADSNSTSLISFTNVVPPSPHSLIARVLRLRYRLQVVSTIAAAANRGIQCAAMFFNQMTTAAKGADAAAAGAPDVTASFCAFPIQSVAQTISLTLNGTETTVQASDLIHALSRTLSEEELTRYASECPCYLDDMTSYTREFGSARGPIGNVYYKPRTRSEFAPLTNVLSGANLIQTQVYEFVEDLWVSPFTLGNRSDLEGLAHVNNISLQIRLGDIQKMVSACNTTGTVVVQANFVEIPSLELVYYQLPEAMRKALPPKVYYPYDHIQRFQTTYNPGGLLNVAPAVSNYGTSAIQLPSIPHKLVIFVQYKPSNKTQATSDTFAHITGVDITFMGRTGLLANMTSFDLWRMSCENGLNVPYQQWRNGCGSVLIVRPDRNLGLEVGSYVGVAGEQTTFQASLSFDFANYLNATDAESPNVAMDINIVPITEGKCVLSDDLTCQFVTLDINKSTVNTLSSEAPVEEPPAASGSGLHRVRKFLKRRHRGGSSLGGAPLGGASLGGRVYNKRHPRE